jgi:hypothetical protein
MVRRRFLLRARRNTLKGIGVDTEEESCKIAARKVEEYRSKLLVEEAAVVAMCKIDIELTGKIRRMQREVAVGQFEAGAGKNLSRRRSVIGDSIAAFTNAKKDHSGDENLTILEEEEEEEDEEEEPEPEPKEDGHVEEDQAEDQARAAPAISSAQMAEIEYRQAMISRAQLAETEQKQHRISRGSILRVVRTTPVRRGFDTDSAPAGISLVDGDLLRVTEACVDPDPFLETIHVHFVCGWVSTRDIFGQLQMDLYDQVVAVNFTDKGSLGINFGADSESEPGWIAAIKEGGLASKFSLETGLWITHVDGEAVFTYKDAVSRIVDGPRPLFIIFSKQKPELAHAASEKSLYHLVQQFGEEIIVGKTLEATKTTNVEADFDVDSEKVSVMHKGELFTCLESKIMWEASQLRLRTSRGWLSAKSATGESFVSVVSSVLPPSASEILDEAATLVGKMMLVVAPTAAIRAGASFESEKIGRISFGEAFSVLETMVVDGFTRLRLEPGWTSTTTRGGQTLLILANSFSTVLFRCVAPATVRASPQTNSQKVGRVLPEQVVEVLAMKHGDGKARMKISHGWVSETTARGGCLFELIEDMAAAMAATEIDEESDDDALLIDYSSDMSLHMSAEEFVFPARAWEDGDLHDYSIDIAEKAYIAALCLLINGSAANQIEFEETVPQHWITADCSALRQALAIGGETVLLERHANELLPRAMRAAADVSSEIELQQHLAKKHPFYGENMFPLDSEAGTPYASWLLHEESRLSNLQGNLSQRSMFAGRLVLKIMYGASLTPPGQWKQKDPPQLAVKITAIAGDEFVQQTVAQPIHLESGTAQWLGEEIAMEFNEEPALVKLTVIYDEKELGEAIVALPWVPAPTSKHVEVDVPLLWKHFGKALKLASSSAVAASSLGCIHVNLQYTHRKFLLASVGPSIASNVPLADLPGEKICINAHIVFRYLIRSLFKYKESRSSIGAAVEWLLDMFGNTFGVGEMYRKLCEMRCILSDFQLNSTCLSRVDCLLEQLTELSKRPCTNSETDLLGQIVDFLNMTLARSFCTYKSSFPPKSTDMTDALTTAIAVHGRVDGNQKDTISASIKSWATNVVQRITQGALHNDEANSLSFIKKQQSLGARTLLNLCDVIRADIQDDDLIYQWVFPDEVPLVAIICREYYQHLQQGVFLILFNSTEEEYSTESTLKLFTKVRDLHATIREVAPDVRLQDVTSFFTPILDAHLMNTQIQLITWSTQAAEGDNFEGGERFDDDDLDIDDGAGHSSSADDIFRILGQNVQPLLDFWEPPRLASVFCIALRAYCDSICSQCEQDLPEGDPFADDEDSGGGNTPRDREESTAENSPKRKGKWALLKERTEIKAEELKVKATKVANEKLKAVSAESSAQRKLIEGMYAGGDITEDEMNQMLSTLGRQEELDREDRMQFLDSNSLTLKEKLKQKAAEEFIRRRAKADAEFQAKILSKARIQVPDSFWIRVNSLYIVADERMKELAYDSSELFGSVAGYNQLYSDKVSHEFTKAMIYSRKQLKVLIHKLLAQYGGNLLSVISTRISAAAAGELTDWGGLKDYFNESLEQAHEMLYNNVFQRVLLQMFEIFCHTLELILLGEIRVANFATPGPCVTTLSAGLQDIADYFYQGGEGLSSRMIDNKTDEDSRLSVILGLHEEDTKSLIRKRSKVDLYMYNQEIDSLQPLLDSFWLHGDIPLPGCLETNGEIEYQGSSTSVRQNESRRDFARFFLANKADIMRFGVDDDDGPTPITSTTPYSGSVSDDVTEQAVNEFQGHLNDAIVSANIILSTEALETLCSRVIEHMTVSPGIKLVTEFEVSPSLLQPKFILLIDSTKVRVVTYMFIGEPIKGDRPDRKYTPYILTILTDDLLERTVHLKPPPPVSKPAESIAAVVEKICSSTTLKEGWMRVEVGRKKKAVWERRWFKLLAGGMVLMYDSDADDAENLLDFKCSNCNVCVRLLVLLFGDNAILRTLLPQKTAKSEAKSRPVCVSNQYVGPETYC